MTESRNEWNLGMRHHDCGYQENAPEGKEKKKRIKE